VELLLDHFTWERADKDVMARKVDGSGEVVDMKYG